MSSSTCQLARPLWCMKATEGDWWRAKWNAHTCSIGSGDGPEREDCQTIEAFTAAMRWPGSRAAWHRWETITELPETYRSHYDEEKKAYVMAHLLVERCTRCNVSRVGPWFDQAGGARHQHSCRIVGVPGPTDSEPPCPIQLCWVAQGKTSA